MSPQWTENLDRMLLQTTEEHWFTDKDKVRRIQTLGNVILALVIASLDFISKVIQILFMKAVILWLSMNTSKVVNRSFSLLYFATLVNLMAFSLNFSEFKCSKNHSVPQIIHGINKHRLNEITSSYWKNYLVIGIPYFPFKYTGNPSFFWKRSGKKGDKNRWNHVLIYRVIS